MKEPLIESGHHLYEESNSRRSLLLDYNACSRTEIGKMDFNVFFVQVIMMKNSIHLEDKIRFELDLE
jgi:hypothetical protein